MLNASNPEPCPRIVGRSPQTQEMLRLIEKARQSNFPVLLLGETGTGKELVARAIHRGGAGPFVTIDCSALVGPLMESELFGHVRGAFTGATSAKTGLIELAHGGTAFFDEIGELPLELQAKLLRVLQQKEFRPIGSLVTKRSDFRVIAATNRDLAREVERGAFRQDLYYRLAVVTIRLAPLRERKEDIPLLVEHFLARYGRGHKLTSELGELLLRYPWPGNVRELENSIQRMVAVNTGPLLHLADLPSTLRNFLHASTAACAVMAAAANAGSVPRPPAPSLAGEARTVLPLAEVEKRAILHALEVTKGDRSLAASLLGIGRTTLYRKLREYRLAGSIASPALA
jgi:transcriptional regulator with PAS, ATPase and Fis domain